MISNRTAKFIKSLQIKKYRKTHHSFIVEGEKSIVELLRSPFEVETLFYTEKLMNVFDFAELELPKEAVKVNEKDLERVSLLQSNDMGLAIAKIPQTEEPVLSGKLIIGLEDVRDPGNLGTIIRIADWYGIDHILCTPSCVDCYNPKVIQATMGSFTRVQVHYLAMDAWPTAGYQVWGAALEGEPLHHTSCEGPVVLLMGNESNGLSGEALSLCDDLISIPGKGRAESLNVSVATGVFCDNLTRLLEL